MKYIWMGVNGIIQRVVFFFKLLQNMKKKLFKSHNLKHIKRIVFLLYTLEK